MPKILKSKPKTTSQIKKTSLRREAIVFSFQLFDGADHEMCPDVFPAGYVKKLMERLRAISAWSTQEFVSNRNASLRSHTHDWSKTARPFGFSNFGEQFKGLDGWQFCLSANEHGRVHGLFLANVFYIIWLDVNHSLYA